MSGAAELLVTLEAAGVVVSLNTSGDGLTLSAAIQPPTELLTQIRAAKPALLEVLRGVLPAHSLPAVSARTCNSCARWEALALPLAHMGLCSAGRAAHSWYDGNPVAPVEIQAAHCCAAHGGKSYRARASSPRPPAELVAAAIPPPLYTRPLSGPEGEA